MSPDPGDPGNLLDILPRGFSVVVGFSDEGGEKDTACEGYAGEYDEGHGADAGDVAYCVRYIGVFFIGGETVLMACVDFADPVVSIFKERGWNRTMWKSRRAY